MPNDGQDGLDFDAIVIGGGIAGVAVARELAASGSVAVLEMERQLATHTTGRSAATFLESTVSGVVGELTTASRAFLTDPPAEFDAPVLEHRPLVQIARPGRAQVVEETYAAAIERVPDLRLLDETEVRELCPEIRRGAVAAGLLEPRGQEIDVHGLTQGYVRSLKARGGRTITGAGAVAAERSGRRWHVRCADGRVRSAGVVVNAAGAWADEIAQVFGATTIGVQPLRRTMFVSGTQETPIARSRPIVGEIDGTFYYKPEGDGFLCSPAEETLSPPGDVAADDLEIARAFDAINEMTTLGLRSVRNSWAGLRVFSADRGPVVGFDPAAEDFFWFAGLGGFGIQTAPALADCAGRLLSGGRPPLADAVAPGRPGLGRAPKLAEGRA